MCRVFTRSCGDVVHSSVSQLRRRRQFDAKARYVEEGGDLADDRHDIVEKDKAEQGEVGVDAERGRQQRRGRCVPRGGRPDGQQGLRVCREEMRKKMQNNLNATEETTNG